MYNMKKRRCALRCKNEVKSVGKLPSVREAEVEKKMKVGFPT